MQEIVYKHIRNQAGKLIATRCTIVDTEGCGVGVGYAVCAENDNFSRKTGREISVKRAVKALYSKRSSFPVRRITWTLNYLWSELNVRYKSVYFVA